MPAPALDVYRKYGLPGDPIPGSRYVRDYCRMCGEPIRVRPMTAGLHGVCDTCMKIARERTTGKRKL